MLYLHIALDKIKRSDSHVSESTAKNPTSSTSQIISWWEHLYLLRRCWYDKVLWQHSMITTVGWWWKLRLLQEVRHSSIITGASGRRVKKAWDQRLTRIVVLGHLKQFFSLDCSFFLFVGFVSLSLYGFEEKMELVLVLFKGGK